MFKIIQPKVFMLSCLAIGLCFLASASYIHVKALLAQYLIASSWQVYINEDTVEPPWPWADTYVVAKLSLKGDSMYVLSGVSGRTLAFGPGHLSSSPIPSNKNPNGNMVIAGHRDTHFSLLELVSIGEHIEIETSSGRFKYRVHNLEVIHEQQLEVTAPTAEPTLTLITCYPFNAIANDTQWRFIVQAQLQT